LFTISSKFHRIKFQAIQFQIVLKYLERKVPLTGSEAFQPVEIVGGRAIMGKRYYVVRGVTPGSNLARHEIVSSSMMNKEFPQVC
jgi:hypothetical protein